MTRAGDHIPTRPGAQPPVVTTARLTLRLPQPSDLPAYTEFCASDRAGFVGGPFTADQARAKLDAMIAHWDTHGFGRFVITRDGRPIGHVGPMQTEVIEITWTLWCPDAQGQGLAEEAARATLDWTAAQLLTTVVVSRVFPGNRRSAALAKRLGGVDGGPTTLPDGTEVHQFLHRLPTVSAPVLLTDRVLLRPHTAADIGALTQLMGTERAQYMDGPLDEVTAWRWLMADTALWQTKGHGPWGLERRSDGAFLGQVSVAQPPNFPELELGWTLFHEAEGHGYAREAATAARDWAFDRGATTLVSYIDPANARSIALAERLGAQLDEAAPGPDPACLVYRHTAPELRP